VTLARPGQQPVVAAQSACVQCRET
jgi:hypothetical protein